MDTSKTIMDTYKKGVRSIYPKAKAAEEHGIWWVLSQGDSGYLGNADTELGAWETANGACSTMALSRVAGLLIEYPIHAKNAVLCWNPGTAEVAVTPYPDVFGLSDRYQRTSMGVMTAVRSMGFEQAKLYCYIEAMHLIVRDGCDPQAVHRALLNVKEYVDACANDMPFRLEPPGPKYVGNTR